MSDENKPKNEDRPTLCLVMIVRNEEDIIKRCLDSVVSWIDYWIICDTGSTDNTKKKIKSYFKDSEIPGELLEHEWRDFGYNRTLAVDAAQGKADFGLLVDADFILNVGEGEDFRKRLSREIDAYYIRYNNEIEHQQTLLINLNKGLPWKFHCRTHEYIFYEGLDLNSCPIFEEITFTHKADGGCRGEKHERDVKLLEMEISEKPTDARSHFYLAQAYFNLKNYEKATEHYKIRAGLGGYEEEVYYSMYGAGYCKLLGAKSKMEEDRNKIMKQVEKSSKKQKKKNKGKENTDKSQPNLVSRLQQEELNKIQHQYRDNLFEFMADLLHAYESRPERLEAIYELVKFCRENGMYQHGYQMGKIVLDRLRQPDPKRKAKSVKDVTLYNGLPKDKLFIEKELYEWRYWDEFAICAFYQGKYQLSIDLWMSLIKEKSPSLDVDHVKKNLGHALAKRKEEISEKAKWGDMPRVTISLTTIPSRLEKLDNTLNSLKNQTYRNTKINLCLPEHSNKENCRYEIPDRIREDPKINIIRADCDYGPATKLLPTLQNEKDPDALIMVADDDVIYGPEVVEKLVKASKKYPDCAIGYCGWNAKGLVDRGWYDLLYEEEKDFGDVAPVNILEGYRGVLYKKKFFDFNVFSYTGYIEDLRWVDDVWFSGHLALRGVPKIVIKWEKGHQLDKNTCWYKLWQNNYEGDKKDNNSLSTMPGFRNYNLRGVLDFDSKRSRLWEEELVNISKILNLPYKEAEITWSNRPSLSETAKMRSDAEKVDNVEGNNEIKVQLQEGLQDLFMDSLESNDKMAVQSMKGNMTFLQKIRTENGEGLRGKYKTGILINTYNRPEFLDLTIKYLKKSAITNSILVFVDDFSQDNKVHLILNSLLFELDERSIPCLLVNKRQNCNMYHSLKLGWSILNYLEVEYLTNLDSDVILKPDWLNRIEESYKTYLSVVEKNQPKDELEKWNENLIVTGFNANNKTHHKVIGTGSNYCLKSSIGGINFYFRRSLFEKIKPCLIDIRWDYRIVSYIQQKNMCFVCTRPSVMQHIGVNGVNSNYAGGDFDIALDFTLDEDADFYYLPGMDSDGGDLYNAETKDIDALKKRCLEDPKAIGFNPNGWIKGSVKPDLKAWDFYDVLRFKGTWIKKSAVSEEVKKYFGLDVGISKDISLTSDDQVKPFLIVGISTVLRKGQNYLMETVESLVEAINFTRDSVKIVIFNANLPPKDHIYIDQIREKYGNLIAQQHLEIFKTNADRYPDLENLPQNFGDSKERVYWRSKACLDHSYIYEHCLGKSRYFLHLDDDVYTRKNFFPELKQELLATPERERCSIFRLNKLGSVAVLYHERVLEKMMQYLQRRYYEKPEDWLINDFIKENSGCYELLPTCYFQHIGESSSLEENNVNKSRLNLRDERFKAGESNLLKEYVYFRELPTGLGDRIGVYMCVAAMGRALNSKVHVYWCCKQPSHMNLPLGDWCSDFEKIKKYLTFPDTLVFHDRDELAQNLDKYIKLDWEKGKMPSKLAYDCLPPLAYLTVDVKIDREKYLNSYREVSKQFIARDPTNFTTVSENYGVIHVRGGDKKNWYPQFVGTTCQIVSKLSEKVKEWYVMTDDQDTCKVFTEFGKFHAMPVTPGLDGTLRDFSILMNAKVIVQHCELGWSAYSHIASLLRETPIINTYPDLNRNIAENLKRYNGWPSNFYNYSDIERLLTKI